MEQNDFEKITQSEAFQILRTDIDRLESMCRWCFLSLAVGIALVYWKLN